MSVYIEGSVFEQRSFAEMFIKSGCSKAKTPEEADLVVFTGGEDVNPDLYDAIPHSSTRFNLERDKRDAELYNYCEREGVPMLGICRGAQFLCVMNGGSLFQDVTGHNTSHHIWDKVNKVQVRSVSSVHHQMVQDDTENGMEVIAHCYSQSSVRHIEIGRSETGPNSDIEAFFYRKTGCLGIQGHPEYQGYDDFTQWSLKRIEQYFQENPDYEYRNKVLRMKPDLLLSRELERAL